MRGLSPDDRPREKLVRHGVAALGDNELVAVVLGSGCRGTSVLAVANELLASRATSEDREHYEKAAEQRRKMASCATSA